MALIATRLREWREEMSNDTRTCLAPAHDGIRSG